MKQWQVGALFVAGLAVGGATVWFLTGSDDSSPKASPTSPATVSSSSASPGVAANAQELLDRLDKSSDATFHVQYSTGSQGSSHANLEVWHTADRVRRDVIAVSPTEGTAHTVEILADQKFVRCVKFEGKAWQCVGAPLAESGSLTDPLQGAAPDVTDKKVTTSSATIAGHAATCYTIAASALTGKPSKFCLSSDNVPLRIDGGDGKPVDATAYDTAVPDSVFTPPGPVSS